MSIVHTAARSGAPKERIVVAMSGGVDSSVAAALLVREGYDVIGITLQLYDHGAATGRKGSCCAGQDIHDARRVAEALGIPHYVLDYERRFADKVINAFADSYAVGETPIPCVTCNSQIKFTDLLETARELGASALATGHYIRRVEGPDGPELRRAVDADRDQSYFLFSTSREQLKALRFPLGGLPKSKVREIAREIGLITADKADSQDICFVPKGHYSDVIERLKPDAVKPGAIVHVDGRTLGAHNGIINYTVGQRRGLGIPGPEPLYVVRLDASRAEVIVGPKDQLDTRLLELRGFNWLGRGLAPPATPDGLPVFARVRSTQSPRAARLFVSPEGGVSVELIAGEGAVAAGQACVLYEDETDTARILGGGTIARALKEKGLGPGTRMGRERIAGGGLTATRPEGRLQSRDRPRRTELLAYETERSANMRPAPSYEPSVRATASRVLTAVANNAAVQMDEDAVRTAYRRWAPVYDSTFGLVSTAGRRHAVDVINESAGRVLEVGVGTGLSLPRYAKHLEIVGIDLAPEMLEKARGRVASQNLDHVTGLHEMDAGNLQFPDNAFDTVVAMYVITVVPEPDKVMRELARVVKPGGQVLLVNHFSQEEGVRGFVERRMAPFAELLGWHSVFELSRVTGINGLELKDSRSLRPFGIFTMVRFVKDA